MTWWLPRRTITESSGGNKVPNSHWTKHVIDDTWSQGHGLTNGGRESRRQARFLTGKRYMAHDHDPGSREPLGIYWYEFLMDEGTVRWVKHVIDYSSRTGAGLHIPTADLYGDGGMEFAAAGKNGLFLFENRPFGEAGGIAMKFGVNTFIWTASFDRSHFALLPGIKKAGFDGVELPLINLAEVDAGAIRKTLAENELECTFCSVIPSGMSVISDDAGVRAKTREHLESCIQVAAEAGAKLIAGPIYSPVGYLPGRRRNVDEWRRAVECYQSLGDTLENNDVTIAIEPLNRFETYFLNTAEDAAALCDAVSNPRSEFCSTPSTPTSRERYSKRIPPPGPAFEACPHL